MGQPPLSTPPRNCLGHRRGLPHRFQIVPSALLEAIQLTNPRALGRAGRQSRFPRRQSLPRDLDPGGTLLGKDRQLRLPRGRLARPTLYHPFFAPRVGSHRSDVKRRLLRQNLCKMAARDPTEEPRRTRPLPEGVQIGRHLQTRLPVSAQRAEGTLVGRGLVLFGLRGRCSPRAEVVQGLLAVSGPSKIILAYMWKSYSEWRADRLGRSGVMPHTKSYCRTSPCHNKMAWFLLTSANVSRAAWGRVINDGEGVFVKNYEAGVMFLPKFFDEDCFEIGESSDNKNVRLFPFLFDLPLTEYKAKDHPWCT
jgi:hypothetical protein